MLRSTVEFQKILEGYFKKHPEIELAYIFGSVAQGRINVLSDIDIALLLDIEKIDDRLYNYGYKAQILSEFMKLLRTNNVDLVILNEANPLLKHRVLYFGKLIYSNNEKKRIQFQIDTINKYNDYIQLIKPHLAIGGKK